MTFQPVFEVAGLPDVKLACWVLEDIDRELRHEMRKPHLRGASIYIAGPTTTLCRGDLPDVPIGGRDVLTKLT